MAISEESRKRLWGRSGNRCAMCRQELVRPDEEGPGALIGQEAHIIGKRPGAARHQPLGVRERDAYDNLILLCANDHREVDTQFHRYPPDLLRNMKREHEAWVRARLHPGAGESQDYVETTVMVSGSDLWQILFQPLGFDAAGPDYGLTDEEATLIDRSLQTFVDWGDISGAIAIQGFAAVREAKKSLSESLDELLAAGFIVLAGEGVGSWAGGEVQGKVAVIRVCRPDASPGIRTQGSANGGQESAPRVSPVSL